VNRLDAIAPKRGDLFVAYPEARASSARQIAALGSGDA